ncbi:unnamed protein product [Rotaria sordida]|uniref:SH2 domain-containing protein n=1 Tax=Rotaria sordida TaxID=392033 RepID=A0A814F2F5_9BILA|nr:unnamed protein product [Rotaria sordida]
MISKSKALKKNLTTKNHANSMIDYTSYKYLDIQKKWIICEGYLHYRYDQIKLLNLSRFANYYVVLAKIPIEDDKPIFVMYLYGNQKQKPLKFFQLDEYERISDQCSKPIESKYVLFELIGKDKSDIEVFGANNSDERDKWIKHIHQILNRTNHNFISNDSTQRIINNEYHTQEERHSSLSESNSTSILRHRPPLPIPDERYLKLNENNQREIQRCHRSASSPTADNIYLSVTKSSQCFIKGYYETNTKSQSNLEIETEKDNSTSLEDKSFTWADIFYANERNDHANILNTICQIGAFLVRPHSIKSNSNHHDHTLSIYAYGEIIKYKILILSNGKYSLVTNNSQPCFFTIPDLCQYYTNHELPRSTLRVNSIKETVENIYLERPYTYYAYH